MYWPFIGLRYLRRRVTAKLAIVAVTFGVATLLTVLSIMEGYIERLQEMIREQEADIIVFVRPAMSLCDGETLIEEIRKIPGVVEVAPFIQTIGMYRSVKFNPCLLRGIDPARELRVTALGKYLLRPEELEACLGESGQPGDYESFKNVVEKRAQEILADPDRRPLSPDEAVALFSRPWREEIFERHNAGMPGGFRQHAPSAIVVGFQFLTSRNLMVGQIVKVLSYDPETSKPLDGNFIVTGAFKSGHYEFDSKAFLVHIRRMSTFLAEAGSDRGEDCYDGLRIALADGVDEESLRPLVFQAVGKHLGTSDSPEVARADDFEVKTWRQINRIYLEAVLIEKWIMGFVVSLVNIFTGCIILLMLILIVIEKTRDAGILLSLGATPWSIFAIFLFNGLVIALVGTVLGLGLGYLFIHSLNTVHDWIFALTGTRLFDPEVYLMDRIPTAIRPADVILSVLPAIVFGLLASLVPAAWAARKDPIQSIHYE